MRRLLLTVSLLISIPLTLPAQQRELGGKEHIQMGTERPLEEAFLHPSDAAKPRTEEKPKAAEKPKTATARKPAAKKIKE